MKQRKLSDDALAKMVHANEGTIGRLRRGVTGSVDLPILTRIVQALGCTLADVMEGEGTKVQKVAKAPEKNTLVVHEGIPPQVPAHEVPSHAEVLSVFARLEQLGEKDHRYHPELLSAVERDVVARMQALWPRKMDTDVLPIDLYIAYGEMKKLNV
jgi:transcriptional regulator with XRE-family HTH domain